MENNRSEESFALAWQLLIVCEKQSRFPLTQNIKLIEGIFRRSLVLNTLLCSSNL